MGQSERSNGVLLAIHYAGRQARCAGSAAAADPGWALPRSGRWHWNICSICRRRWRRSWRVAAGSQPRYPAAGSRCLGLLARPGGRAGARGGGEGSDADVAGGRTTSGRSVTADAELGGGSGALPRAFYARPTSAVARDLLGKVLVTARPQASRPASSSKWRHTSASPIRPATPRRVPQRGMRRCTARRAMPTCI